MKTNYLFTILISSFLAASYLQAQEETEDDRKGPRGKPGTEQGKGGPGKGGPGAGGAMKFMPVLAALDADQDGRISSEEIDNAAAALRTLDKNGDGALTEDEVRPSFGGGAGGGGRSNRGGGSGKADETSDTRRMKGKGKGKGNGKGGKGGADDSKGAVTPKRPSVDAG